MGAAGCWETGSGCPPRVGWNGRTIQTPPHFPQTLHTPAPRAPRIRLRDRTGNRRRQCARSDRTPGNRGGRTAPARDAAAACKAAISLFYLIYCTLYMTPTLAFLPNPKRPSSAAPTFHRQLASLSRRRRKTQRAQPGQLLRSPRCWVPSTACLRGADRAPAFPEPPFAGGGGVTRPALYGGPSRPCPLLVRRAPRRRRPRTMTPAAPTLRAAAKAAPSG